MTTWLHDYMTTWLLSRTLLPLRISIFLVSPVKPSFSFFLFLFHVFLIPHSSFVICFCSWLSCHGIQRRWTIHPSSAHHELVYSREARCLERIHFCIGRSFPFPFPNNQIEILKTQRALNPFGKSIFSAIKWWSNHIIMRYLNSNSNPNPNPNPNPKNNNRIVSTCRPVCLKLLIFNSLTVGLVNDVAFEDPYLHVRYRQNSPLHDSSPISESATTWMRTEDMCYGLWHLAFIRTCHANRPLCPKHEVFLVLRSASWYPRSCIDEYEASFNPLHILTYVRNRDTGNLFSCQWSKRTKQLWKGLGEYQWHD